jgi:hypothetical protein
VHQDDANEPWLHGSPALLPKTGTVKTEPVSGLPALQPGRRFKPKKYWVASGVVTFQYSLLLSPLTVLVSRSTRVPSSFFSLQTSGLVETWMSSPPWPGRDRVALSVPQQRSPMLLWPSSTHAL